MDDSPPPQPPEASPPPPPPVTTGSPTDFLKNVVGKRVVVRLTSGVDYRGKFVLFCLAPSAVTQLTLIERCIVLPRWVHEHRA